MSIPINLRVVTLILLTILLGGVGWSDDQLRDADITLEREVTNLITEAEILADSDQLDSAMVLAYMADSMVNNHPELSDTIAAAVHNSLAFCLLKSEQLDQSMAQADSALMAWNRANRSPDSLYAEIYNSYGRVHIYRSNYQEAFDNFEKALAVQTQVLGPEHLEVAATYNNLATASAFSGDPEAAEELFNKALGIWRSQLGPDHPDVGLCLINLGYIYDDLKRFEEAEESYRESLRIREKALGPEHSSIGIIYLNIGSVQEQTGRVDSALISYQRAHDIIASSIGEESYWCAATKASIATILCINGRYAEAERLYKESISNIKQVAGENSCGLEYYRLALLYQYQGKFEESHQCILRACEISKHEFGDSSIEYAGYIAATIGTYSRLVTQVEGAADQIDSLYEVFSLIIEQPGMSEHSMYGPSLSYVASAFCNIGRHEDAMYLLNKVLPTEKDPILRASLLNIAIAANSCSGDGSRALALADELTGIIADTDIFPNRRLAGYHSQLAQTYFFWKYPVKSLEHYRESDKYRRLYLKTVFPHSSQLSRVTLLSDRGNVRFLINLIAQLNDHEALSFGLEHTMTEKSYILDAITKEHEVIQCSSDPDLMRICDEYADVSSRAASLVRASVFDEEADVSLELIRLLLLTRDSLETVIGATCGDSNFEKHESGLKANEVARCLGKDQILVEYVHFLSSDTAASDALLELKNQFDYGAFVMDSDGQIDFFNLGAASVIDSLVKTSRQQIDETGLRAFTSYGRDAEQQLGETNRGLYELLLKPLEHRLEGKNQLIIAPVKGIYLIPFEILPVGKERYLLEKYAVKYVSSGRSLVAANPNRQANDGPIVIFSNPDYEFDIYKDSLNDTSFVAQDDQEDPSLAISPFRSANDCDLDDFLKLAYATRETESIESVVHDRSSFAVQLYTDSRAREKELKELPEPPRVLHMATHGFVCNPEYRPMGRKLIWGMFQSGLALAGANTAPDTASVNQYEFSEDGILSAYEVSGLDLVGTDLVVLSACETGVGEYVNGIGVMGLRSSFRQAGAESVIMSLWKVPDELSARTMASFYERWLSGESKCDALRNASRELLEEARTKYGNGHPIHWAGYIYEGSQ